MKKLLFLLPVFITFSLFSQEEIHSSLTIPEDLGKNANAVVRLDKTDVNVHSRRSMQVSKRRVVCVLNKSGDDAINAFAHYDPKTRLKKVEAVIYDAFGKEIKKFRKNDFKDVSAVDGGTLYGDSRVKYLDYTATAYPYTVDFVYIHETANTAFLPNWYPIDEYLVSVQKSSYTINTPTELQLRFKEKNLGAYDVIKNRSEINLSYSLAGIPALKKEQLSPAFYEVEPSVLFSLSNFHLEGVDGDGDDWTSFGKWQYNELLVDRDVLPESTKRELDRLLNGIDDPIEKAKVIYKYVQDNTRYISVQLGIGGWMPIEAEEVDKVKYGDCKGLTNYTKALLKSQGIDSYYSVVWAGNQKRSMEPDFASMQGNHVILNIPNGDDDIWLECTSQVKPFGFIGDFTDDRDVLVLTSEGGKLKRTRSYLNDENKMFTDATYEITEQGGLKAKVNIICEGVQYDNRYFRIAGLSDEKKDEYYKNYWDNVNNLKIVDKSILNNAKEMKCKEELELVARDYCSNAGEDILFRINPFNANSFVPDRYRNRKQPFEISRGYTDIDRYAVTIPLSFKLNSLPEPIKLDTKYGSYEMSITKKSETELIYSRKLQILKGKYPKEEYNDYRNFRRSIAKSDNLKIVLTK